MTAHHDHSVLIASACSAMANTGNSWPACWLALLAGRGPMAPASTIIRAWAEPAPIALLSPANGMRTDVPQEHRAHHLTMRLARSMKADIHRLLAADVERKVSILVTTSHGEPGAISAIGDRLHASPPQVIEPALWATLLTEDLVDAANRGLGLKLTGATISAACASGLVGASYAADQIESGWVDAVLLISVDTISRVAVVGFNNLGALTRHQCRPFDKDRDGTVVGEGGVALLLVRQGLLPPHQTPVRIVGSSHNCDASHLVEPSTRGIESAIDLALTRAQVSPRDIAGIYWHGTGTRQNDAAEATAAAAIFGSRSPPCSSTKGCLGHTMGASSAFNVLAACSSLTTRRMPHTRGTLNPEFDNLDLVLHAPRAICCGPILINALGFGGINAALIVEKSGGGS